MEAAGWAAESTLSRRHREHVRRKQNQRNAGLDQLSKEFKTIRCEEVERYSDDMESSASPGHAEKRRGMISAENAEFGNNKPVCPIEIEISDLFILTVWHYAGQLFL